MDEKLREKLDALTDRYDELSRAMADPAVASVPDKYKELSKEHASLTPVVTAYRRFKEISSEMEDNKALIDGDDPELSELAASENKRLQSEAEELEKDIKILLIPKDPADDKNVILEIRAGTGGEEAALFAADLFRMYTRYAESKRWKVEVLSSNVTGKGGFKEVIALISGKGVYSALKYESGVHRVQRVPETESQGRIHTSAVTVAVLPEADEIEVNIDERDLRVDVFRSSGPGGQSVNTTDSAVRITHIPTGIVVSCQDEKSQHKNKAKAMKILKARLLDMEKERQQKERSESRRNQVGTGDRSERIRTYNFPQGRVTDHRIGLTLYQLDDVMNGNLDVIIPQVRAHFQAEALKEGI